MEKGLGDSHKQAKPNPTATFQTSMGEYTIELLLDKMPITCSSFIQLAQSGFYNNLVRPPQTWTL